MGGGRAGSNSRAHDRAHSTANRSAYDSSAAGARAEYSEVLLHFRAGDDVPFALDAGVRALRIDDLSVHVVAGTVGQNKLIRTQVKCRSAVDTTGGGGEYHSAVQLRTRRHNHLAVAHDVLGDLATERCIRGGAVGFDFLQHANPENCSLR